MKMNLIFLVGYEDHFIDKKHLCIVMEFCREGDLRKAIQIQRKKQEQFSEDIVIIWFGQLTSALKYLQSRKILHRDLKPDNIFMASFHTLKIGDFGLSTILERSSDMAQTNCGTVSYMAPEILRGQDYDEKADIWSMGCVVYELCTLEQAFSGGNIGVTITSIKKCAFKPVPDNVHPEVAPFVGQILVKNPDKRPTAEQIRDR